MAFPRYRAGAGARACVGAMPWLILCALLAGQAAAGTEVTAVDLEEEGRGLQLEMTLEGDTPDYRIFALTDPLRIVVDFPETGWTIEPPRSGRPARWRGEPALRPVPARARPDGAGDR